ncbi:2-keto-4-pentenoate hydratase [Mesorhizobium sp. L-8-10]|uniref:2-keto-4-pentenoate hydratase n=1 Tax=unclassified Mesorhizobium TaxID=325217 RepID=UPI0019253588|nr:MULTISPECIES: fumarylacetoacetate hydrolase family protein [unclassified Mesorhizobium]BCH21754.1 2-keto-4-pentenoate hydratase [Mesorhizobium sp. L-8-3]BCH29442.1 2-keto-4-pentenoate hydratase [Mesorhizobium sp. L-8-10]
MAAGGTGDIAAEILATLDAGRQVEPLTARIGGFDSAAAYGVASALRDLRVARGERAIGRKIGFTNRNIWAEYGVYEPIWGDVYDRTQHDIATGTRIRVSHLPEPRIEPEIVLGLGRDVTSDMTLDDIAGAIDWVAHGFEIVQSIFPGWRFGVADCIADGGLHGALFVGPRRSVREGERPGLTAALAGLAVTLSRNGTAVDRGIGSNVLDGPIQALGHLAGVLAGDPLGPPLRKGELVTTGTVTRAFPVAPGEKWSTEIEDFDLPGLAVEIA